MDKKMKKVMIAGGILVAAGLATAFYFIMIKK
jgi:hypothetical protein